VKATPTVPVAAAALEITGGGGLLIVNVWALEVPPLPPGFTTVTETVPAVATLEAGTVATSWVEV
jgi:nitrogen fixation protein